MADNSRYASKRPDDLQPRRGSGAPAAGSRAGGDPLAELARLIGRDDPFADLRRDIGQAPRGEPAPQSEPPAPEWLGRPRSPPAASFSDRDGAGHDPRIDPAESERWRASRYRDQVGREPSDQDYSSDPRDPRGQHPRDPHDPDPHYQDQPYSEEPSDPHHAADGTAYSHGDQGYADAPPPVAGDYESESYYGDEQGPPDGEDTYEAPRERRGGGLMTIVAVVGIIVLLVGGAFAYRSLSGRTGTPGQPPVIAADPSPIKVVPPSQSADSQGKLIYDRTADKGQDAEFVSREEKPVDPRSLTPRVIPGALPVQPPSTVPGAVGTEPKKVKTQTIRPGELQTRSDATDTGSQWPAAPPTTSSTATTIPAQPPGRAPQKPPLGAAPMVVGPQVADAGDANPRVAAVTPSAPQPVRAPEAGGYVVQLFSGKSEGEAQDQFRALQAKYQTVLGGRQPIIRRADLGEKGVYFRAQVGPFGSIEQAKQLCGNLQAAGGQCIVQRN